MKQKILASIATGIIILTGVVSPLFSVVVSAQSGFDWNSSQNSTTGITTPNAENSNLQAPTVETVTTETPSPTESAPEQTGGGTQEITTTASSSSNADQDALDDKKTADENSSASKELDCGANFICGLVQFFGAIFTFSSNLVATVAGLIADFSLWFSIQSNSYGILNTFVESGWKLVRDFGNLIFIFALFVVGFVLIFDTKEDSTRSVRLNPKRTIATVVIMALLVNFSFLITRSVIEVGNVSAGFLYSSIQGVGSGDTNGAVNASNQSVSSVGTPSTWFTSNIFPGMKSVSLGILSKVNPQELILDNSSMAGKGFFWKSYDFGFYVLYIFLAIITAVFNLAMTYIFISMALLFIGRYIGLVFLIIFSPLAFISRTIPALENKEYIGFTDWFSELIGLTFVAPVYLLFVYLTIMFLNTDLFGEIKSGYILIATVVLIKLIITAFVLLRGKSLAVSMSGHIGKMAGGLIDKVAVAGVGLATAGTGMLAAQTYGRVGGLIGKSGTLKRISDQGPANDIESVEKRQSMAGSIRKLGVGRYNPLRSSMNKLASSVEKGDLSVGTMQAKAAGGFRNFGKSMATSNVYDMGIGGMTGRKGMSALVNKTGATYDKDGKMILPGNEALAQGLAQDFVNNPVTGIKKTTAKNRMMDIEASKNAKKTLTNVIGGAMTSGLNSGNQGGGGTPSTPAPTTPPPVPTPPVAPSSGPGGSAPIRPSNTTPAPQPLREERPPQTSDAAQREESERLTGIYDRENRKPANTMEVENLTVKNLNVQSTPSATLPSRPSNSAVTPQKQATTLLAGIQMAPPSPQTRDFSRATSYKPSDFKTSEEARPTESFDQSSVVLDNLPGEGGDFDFGGMGPRGDSDE